LPLSTPLTYQYTAGLLRPVTFAVNCTLWEGGTQAGDGATVMPGPGVPAIPLPCSERIRGLPGALSAMLRLAVYEATACGLKDTSTVQVAPAASVPPPLPLPQFVVNGK
jgi:hypothetical protein